MLVAYYNAPFITRWQWKSMNGISIEYIHYVVHESNEKHIAHIGKWDLAFSIEKRVKWVTLSRRRDCWNLRHVFLRVNVSVTSSAWNGRASCMRGHVRWYLSHDPLIVHKICTKRERGLEVIRSRIKIEIDVRKDTFVIIFLYYLYLLSSWFLNFF